MGDIDFSKLKEINLGNITVDKILAAILVLIVSIVVLKLLMKVLDKWLEKSKVESTLHSFIKSIVKILLCFVVVLMVADAMGIPITSLVALLSVLGLAVSLAVQGMLSNVAGGMMVLYAKPFKVGDFINASDISGTVKEIKLTYTTLQTLDNAMVFIPNSEISAEKIINYTHIGVRRVEYIIGASYDDDTDEVKRVLREVVDGIAGVLPEPLPFVEISDYKDSYIEYAIRFYVPASEYGSAYFGLIGALKKAYDENGLHMTYNHLNVHMMGD